MELSRKPTVQEFKLIECLIEKASISLSSNWKDKLIIQSMDDGQMGSLHLYPDGNILKKCILGNV